MNDKPPEPSTGIRFPDGTDWNNLHVLEDGTVVADLICDGKKTDVVYVGHVSKSESP